MLIFIFNGTCFCRTLKYLYFGAGNSWRESKDGDNNIDPYGATTFHGAIARAMMGEKYNKEAPVKITMEQAGFFIRVVSLIHQLELWLELWVEDYS